MSKKEDKKPFKNNPFLDKLEKELLEAKAEGNSQKIQALMKIINYIKNKNKLGK